MNCKVCGKSILEHNKSDVKECLEKAGISTKGKSAVGIVSEARATVTFNYKHGYLKFEGGEINDSKDMELDLLRVSLTGRNIEAPEEIQEEEEEEYE